MSSYFSNLHIKASGQNCLSDIKEKVTEYLASRGIMASDESNADMEVIIRTQKDGGWVSVLCNGFTHNDILKICSIQCRFLLSLI